MLQHFFICLAFCFLATIASSYACSCIGKSNIADAVKSAEVVLIGKVIKSEIISRRDTIWDYQLRRLAAQKGLSLDSLKQANSFVFFKEIYTIEVVKNFKGKKTKVDTVLIVTGMGNGDCGYQFELGKHYIIYGYKPHDAGLIKDSVSRKFALYATDICTRTQPENEVEISAITAVLKK